jgi:hypothetical protein
MRKERFVSVCEGRLEINSFVLAFGLSPAVMREKYGREGDLM